MTEIEQIQTVMICESALRTPAACCLPVVVERPLVSAAAERRDAGDQLVWAVGEVRRVRSAFHHLRQRAVGVVDKVFTRAEMFLCFA